MNISNILKARREELGVKVKDIATHVGVAESTYRDWENGRNIQGEPYVKLAEILDLPLGHLLGLKNRDLVQNLLLEVSVLERHLSNLKEQAYKII